MLSACIPLSLYIHMPWCVRKCPYCDFNSHAVKDEIPEEKYIDALIADLECDQKFVADRSLHSIFIGGGTPSLFSGSAITRLLKEIASRISFVDDIEITLEANPGSTLRDHLAQYVQAGVNRLSIGVQSFQNEKLKSLGRIHDCNAAKQAFSDASKAGFRNINIDLMHGLPQQSAEDALFDLTNAMQLKPTHLSWYQLTLEPNTLFAKFPPTLPADDDLFEIEQQGKKLLKDFGYEQYEISAYAKEKKFCHHNLNYWEFGDYLGIGAGAHSKLTDVDSQHVWRLRKQQIPANYLKADSFIAEKKLIEASQLPFEFFLNALRLEKNISFSLFEERTGCSRATLSAILERLQSKQLIVSDEELLHVTAHGRLFLNDVMAEFLTNE